MTNNLFGETIKEYEEQEPVQENKKLTPFDYINSISETKKDLMSENEENVREYNSYITNRGLGFFPDTVLYANEMNLHPDIPKKAQYYYYLHSLRKRKRRSKWFKAETNLDLDIICRIYNVRVEVGKQYLKLLDEDQLGMLRKLTETGENTTKQKHNK